MNTADEATPSGRLASLDALRGLIMILMAIDHVSFHVGKRHPGEFWGVPLPEYSEVLPFLTRWVTHLCAPGFFFLMGAGVVLLAASRRRSGWREGRIARHLAVRGLLLIVVQQLIENVTWGVGYFSAAVEIDTYGVAPPGSAGTPFLVFGVLFALGSCLIVSPLLLRLPTVAVSAVGLGAIVATQLLTPGAEDAGTPYSPALRLLLIPGQTGPLAVIYPVLPWLGVTALGMVFGRALVRDARRTFRIVPVAGLGCLAAFAVVRLAGGFGNFHPPADGWIAFLNATKYPPSLAFLLMTLGGNLVLLALFRSVEGRLGERAKPLLVFGGTALFFYLAHLYVYMVLGLAFPSGAGFAAMYGAWLLGLLVLYPLCRSYSAFKRRKPQDSIWRLF